MIEVSLEPRACECCGGVDLEPVWSRQSVVQKSVNDWRFSVHVAVCRRCGFMLASPVTASRQLAQYYAEGLPGHQAIGLPYSIDRRLGVLERYGAPAGVFAEVGGNGGEVFRSRVSALFGRFIGIDVALDAPAEYRSLDDLPEGSVDVLAHYDVLEHVVDVRRFLGACRRALVAGGVMVCEVPDSRLYPRNLLLREFEHVNHFSTTTLGAIAESLGLRLIEVGHACSRPFGFVSVFRKDEPIVRADAGNRLEYLDALACVRGGIEQDQRVRGQMVALRQALTAVAAAGTPATLWAVTDFLRDFLDDGYRLPPGVIVVDTDPRRRMHLRALDVDVREPRDCVAHIAASGLLAIFAPRYHREILEWVARETNRVFPSNQTVIVGAGSSGEPLT